MAKKGELEYHVENIHEQDEPQRLAELGKERWTLAYVLQLPPETIINPLRRLYFARTKDCGCGCGGCD